MKIEPPRDDRFHLDVLSQPAPGMHLTGDYHDFVCLSPDRFLVVVGDGAGTGVRPALLTAMMKIQLRSRLDSPREVLSALNRRLFSVLPRGTDVVATCVVALVDIAAGSITTARAGHDSLFLVSDDVFEAESPTGPALGFDPEAEYEERTYPLQPDTRIVMFTDGLYDRSPRDGSSVGLRFRGMEDLIRHAHGDPHFIDQLLRLITANRILNSRPVIPLFDDDVTILSFLVRKIGPR
jgi:serine phosphatase RsbU (regulator of sigma subunit)